MHLSPRLSRTTPYPPPAATPRPRERPIRRPPRRPATRNPELALALVGKAIARGCGASTHASRPLRAQRSPGHRRCNHSAALLMSTSAPALAPRHETRPWLQLTPLPTARSPCVCSHARTPPLHARCASPSSRHCTDHSVPVAVDPRTQAAGPLFMSLCSRTAPRPSHPSPPRLDSGQIGRAYPPTRGSSPPPRQVTARWRLIVHFAADAAKWAYRTRAVFLSRDATLPSRAWPYDIRIIQSCKACTLYRPKST